MVIHSTGKYVTFFYHRTYLLAIVQTHYGISTTLHELSFFFFSHSKRNAFKHLLLVPLSAEALIVSMWGVQLLGNWPHPLPQAPAESRVPVSNTDTPLLRQIPTNANFQT